MNAEQLLKELTIRFNTDPKRYEKLDYGVLIKLLLLIVDKYCELDTLENIEAGKLNFRINSNNLEYTINGIEWINLGNVKGQDGDTPFIDDNEDHWWIGDRDTGFSAIGKNGENGLSAFELAKNLNLTEAETEEEWIKSLNGSHIYVIADSISASNDADMYNSVIEAINTAYAGNISERDLVFCSDVAVGNHKYSYVFYNFIVDSESELITLCAYAILQDNKQPATYYINLMDNSDSESWKDYDTAIAFVQDTKNNFEAVLERNNISLKIEDYLVVNYYNSTDKIKALYTFLYKANGLSSVQNINLA